MDRLIDETLLQWKNNKNRKPLVVYGARQVGKTHSIVAFGQKHYASFAYFYFDNNPDLCEIFESGISSVKSLMVKLEAYANQTIIPGKTLIVLDEAQNCGAALNSLKLYQETARSIISSLSEVCLAWRSIEKGFLFRLER